MKTRILQHILFYFNKFINFETVLNLAERGFGEWVFLAFDGLGLLNCDGGNSGNNDGGDVINVLLDFPLEAMILENNSSSRSTGVVQGNEKRIDRKSVV